MKRLLLTLSVLALLVSSTFAASVFQLDVCNKHRTVSEAPGTSLTFTKVRRHAWIAAALLIVCPLRTAAAAVCLRHAITAEPHPPPLTSCNVHYITPSRAGLLSVPQHPAHMPMSHSQLALQGLGFRGGAHSMACTAMEPAAAALLMTSFLHTPCRVSHTAVRLFLHTTRTVCRMACASSPAKC